MAKYLVGPYNNSWNFMDAYNKAQNGDIIEFEDGYAFQWPTNQEIVIDKELHFVGQAISNPNGNGQIFKNTIEAAFRFVAGAKVTFENLCFKITGNYSTLLLWSGSEVTCKQVCFEISTQNNQNFFLYADTHSKLILNDIEMKVPEKHDASIGIVASELSISNSRILSRIDLSDGARLTLETVDLEKYDINTISAINSEVTLKNSTVKGGNLEMDYPPVWLDNVVWKSENCKIELPGGTAVCLNNNVQFTSDSDCITSLNSYGSMLRAHQATFTEFLCIYDQSFAALTGETTFLAENAHRISFGAFSDSVVMADQMVFHKIADPNIRLQSSAYVRADAVTYAQGDARDLITEIEDSCDYLVGREVAKANPQTPSSGSASDATVPTTTATASEQETKRDALEELNSLIGLEKVKHEIKKMINMVEFNKKRIANGKAPEKQTRHAAFPVRNFVLSKRLSQT